MYAKQHHPKLFKEGKRLFGVTSLKDYINRFVSAANAGDQVNYLRWVTDESGKVVVNFMGRFEKFQIDFDYICDQIGIERRELARMHKTKHDFYSTYYDEETKEMVRKLLHLEIKMFGYKFKEEC